MDSLRRQFAGLGLQSSGSRLGSRALGKFWKSWSPIVGLIIRGEGEAEREREREREREPERERGEGAGVAETMKCEDERVRETRRPRQKNKAGLRDDLSSCSRLN